MEFLKDPQVILMGSKAWELALVRKHSKSNTTGYLRSTAISKQYSGLQISIEAEILRQTVVNLKLGSYLKDEKIGKKKRVGSSHQIYKYVSFQSKKSSYIIFFNSKCYMQEDNEGLFYKCQRKIT